MRKKSSERKKHNSPPELQRPAHSIIASTNHHRNLIDYMQSGYAFCRMIIDEGRSVDFIYEEVNKGYETLTGLKNVIGRKLTEVMPGIAESNPDFIEKHRQVVETGIPVQFEIYLAALNKWFDINIYRPKKGYLVAIFSDISDRKLIEAELQRMNRALLATNNCNSALVHSNDEMELLQKICDIIVTTGGYRMAWVGYAEHDNAKTIRPHAQAGFEQGYLETSMISWADVPLGQGPAGRAIRNGQPSFSYDIQEDSQFQTWKKEAIERGYASILSLPLNVNNMTIGALTIYSGIPDAFNAKETALLTSLADNLAYGITILRNSEAQKIMEDDLKQSEERLRKMFEGHSSIMLLIDPKTFNIIDANQAAADFYGWTVEELRQMSIQQINIDSYEEKMSNLDKVRKLKQNKFVFRHRRADASIRIVDVVSSSFVIHGREVFYSIINDITEQKEAEAALKKSEERFRMLFEKHSAVMILLDPDTGKIIDANRAAAEFYGWTVEELRNMSIQQITNVTNREVKANLSKARNSEQNQFLFQHKRADGSIRDVEVFSNNIVIEGKDILYAIVHDITERRRYESFTAFRLRLLLMAENHSMEELLMAVLDKKEDDLSLLNLFYSFPGAMILIDRKGTILISNESFSESVKEQQENIIGSNFYTLLPAELVTDRKRKIEEVIFSGERLSFDDEQENQILRHTIFPIPDKDGAINKLLFFSIDITTLALSENEAIDNRVHYRNLFNNMENGFAYCRVIFEDNSPVDFIYEVVNMNFKKLTGLERVEGRNMSEVLPDIINTNPEFLNRLGRVALSGVSEQFEFYYPPLTRWFDIRVYSHQKGYFVMVLSPMITFKTANWEWNLDNGEMIWNDDQRMLFGLDLHSGIPSYELWLKSILPSDKEHTEIIINNAVGQGEAFNVVYNIIDHNDTTRRLMTQGFAVKNDAGYVKRYVGITIDTSDYKNVYSNQLINTTNLDSLLNSCEEAVFSIGRDVIILESNDNFNSIFSTEKLASLNGYDFNNLFSLQLLEERKDKFQHLFESGEPIHFKDMFKGIESLADQENERIYQISAYPVIGEFNKIDSVAVFISLSNERNEAEKARRQFDKQYQTLISASPDSIITTNLEGIISSISDIGLEIYGSNNKSKVIGKPFSSLVYETDIKIIDDIFDITFREGLIQNKEILLKKKNNTLYSAEISAALIQDYNGAPSSYMIIIRDISQRKIIEAELFHAKRLISLGEMASGIAHEIYQPINNIGLIVDNILYEAKKYNWSGEKDIKIKSEKIFENIIRVQTIIDNIRSFTSKDKNYVSSVININKGIRNALMMFTEQCKSKSITLFFKPEKENILVSGNIYKFEQVIANLIKNSIDAIQEKINSETSYIDRKINVNSYEIADTATITIEDNGIGISEKNIDYIMHPFFTTKDSGKGTGLGLSISHGIIKEMNGNIKILSDLKSGTKIIITLPK